MMHPHKTETEMELLSGMLSYARVTFMMTYSILPEGFKEIHSNFKFEEQKRENETESQI